MGWSSRAWHKFTTIKLALYLCLKYGNTINGLMMRKYSFVFILLLLTVTFGCQQVSDIKAFTEARYSLQAVHDLQLNGIDVMQKQQPGDFTSREGDSILTAISDNTLQATTTLYLDVNMPAPEVQRQMKITHLKWQLLVDGHETLGGAVAKPMLHRSGLNKLPINTTVAMTENGGMRNYEGLSKLMTLLAQKKDLRQNLTLQIKPTIETPLGDVEVPQYIKVVGH